MMKNTSKECAAAYTHGELLYIVQQSASDDYIITGITERTVAERNGVRHLTAICVLFVTSGPHRGKWLCHNRAPKQWAKGKPDCKAPSWNFWGGHITASLEQLDVIGQKVSREVCDPGMAVELSEELYCRGTGVELEEWRSPQGPSGTIPAASYHHGPLLPIGLTSFSGKGNCEASYLYALPVSGEDVDSLIAADDYIRGGEKHNIALRIKPMSEDELKNLHKNDPAVEVCDAITRLWLPENTVAHAKLSKTIEEYLKSHG
ncbi:hypothetical protein LJC49_06310 [Ruminococcaceae bacterium OttesenSCG-928-I18]|nr:hypothetical protein [Ruminococcaceae bacterium OttesenSCG-928-I18]